MGYGRFWDVPTSTSRRTSWSACVPTEKRKGVTTMRSTLEIPDNLMSDAQALSGLRTKKETVIAALDEFVRKRRLDGLRARLGRGNFDLTHEDLERMRADEEPVAPGPRRHAVRAR